MIFPVIKVTIVKYFILFVLLEINIHLWYINLPTNNYEVLIFIILSNFFIADKLQMIAIILFAYLSKKSYFKLTEYIFLKQFENS